MQAILFVNISEAWVRSQIFVIANIPIISPAFAIQNALITMRVLVHFAGNIVLNHTRTLGSLAIYRWPNGDCEIHASETLENYRQCADPATSGPITKSKYSFAIRNAREIIWESDLFAI
jgi:hypothetical protein